MKKKSAQLRPYLVTYSVTTPETYRIMATSADEAEQTAFSDGEYVRRGDRVDAVPLTCEPEPAQPKTTRTRSEAP